MNEHIHSPNDRRGTFRTVYVNGNRIDNIAYADTKKGIAVMYTGAVNRANKELVTKTLRGKVEVVQTEYFEQMGT